MSQSVTGTRATADTRSSHHATTPSLAEPRPRASASGARVRRSTINLPDENHTHDPSGYGKGRADCHHGPAGCVDCAEIEAAAGIPEQMADAAAQVQEKTKRAAEQQNL